MTFDEIERLAFTSDAMPSDARVPDYACYEAMRYLYERYRSGNITRKNARAEKMQILKAYSRDCIMYRMFEACECRLRALQTIIAEVQRNGTERERLLIDIMTGCEDPKKYMEEKHNGKTDP